MQQQKNLTGKCTLAHKEIQPLIEVVIIRVGTDFNLPV